MNRRDFFTTLAKGVGLFTILPGAGRIWKALTPPLVSHLTNVNFPFDPKLYTGVWRPMNIPDVSPIHPRSIWLETDEMGKWLGFRTFNHRTDQWDPIPILEGEDPKLVGKVNFSKLPPCDFYSVPNNGGRAFLPTLHSVG